MDEPHYITANETDNDDDDSLIFLHFGAQTIQALHACKDKSIKINAMWVA
jgi:hypothetical protein